MPAAAGDAHQVAFRDPDGVPIEVAHRWTELPDVPDAEPVQVPGHGVTLGGYFFKPQAGNPPYPAVILLHGFAGHAHNMVGLARAFSANGYVALALSLRGWLGSEGENDQGLRQPLDVLAAIDWLAKRPLVDKDRIALVGASMGGQVALLAAAHKPPIRAVASFYGPTDLTRMAEQTTVRGPIDHDSPNSPESKLVGGPIQENKVKAAKANPITYVSKDNPPFLIAHGDKYPLVPLGQSEILLDALKRAEVEAELVVIKDGGHGGAGFATRENQDKIAAFFDRHLKKAAR